MNCKKILITGAGGFIGFELGNYLVERGHSVAGIDLHYPAKHRAPLFDAQVGDFRDESKIRALLKGTEVVFHLASAHLKVNLDESAYWDINVHSLPRLLGAAYALDAARFIHVSSVGVYGNLKSWPADEETACHPQSIYGETKLAGERAVEEFTKQTGFPSLMLRPVWVYGPTCPRTRKLYKSLRSRTFAMIGRGENLRHPIYIDDLLAAFDLAMESRHAEGDLFLVGGEQALTTREIILSMCKVFGTGEPLIQLPYPLGKAIAGSVETSFKLFRAEPPISRRTLEFFDTNNAFDISKARHLLKFNPRFSFEEGLTDCREAFGALA